MELHSAENKYSSCKVSIVLTIVIFTIFTGITIYFVYYNWPLIKNNVSCIKFNIHKETNFIECNSIEYINGRNKTNNY